MKQVLTIAGFDPSGGAGIQRDLETFRAHGVEGVSVITVVTSQVPSKFNHLYILPKKIISNQLSLLLETYPMRVVKTGLLYKKMVVDLVSKKMAEYSDVKLVIDPMMVSSTGRLLLEPKAHSPLKKMMAQAFLVTPNLHEASVLAGFAVTQIAHMKKAAQAIFRFGSKYVLVKGGHLEGEPVDILYDGKDCFEFPHQRILGKGFHGLGCRFSAALTALIAKDIPLPEAIPQVQDFMEKEIMKLVTTD
ncbi:MAG: bifunctional hydroxymethylpyrimidine kinase/phosphomethylpyrimidine kinase [Chlamydiae bacterium]|nr:bifunctional hydroxymethylpyrimidine kinase/phosphomethylpyrimidine kinase [Chlamydiota bacterium]MBI3277452.1 bifunctional hydroxymethylpyrimidine kinase/phosphomethylpyrimidine kinase [Chlamydiota bacterium]